MTSRFGTVALLGRTNVGKSTFLNAALGEALVITSPKPETTRESVLGLVRRGTAQIAFLDTPGLHRPRNELGRRMVAASREAARAADLVVFITDPSPVMGKRVRPGADLVEPGDREALATLTPEQPALLVVNKVDLVRDKQRLLPLLTAYQELRSWVALVPVSFTRADGIDRLLDAIAAALPEGEAGYPEDELTNRPVSWFAREYVREAVLAETGAEVPHAAAVSLDGWDDNGRRVVVQATLHVEKVGQRVIVVGAGGQRLKAIGTAARLRLENLVGRPVHLELFVRVTPGWKDTPRQLSELGYDTLPGTGKERDVAPRKRTGKQKKRKPRGDAPRDPGAARERGSTAAPGATVAEPPSTAPAPAARSTRADARGPAQRGGPPDTRGPAPRGGRAAARGPRPATRGPTRTGARARGRS